MQISISLRFRALLLSCILVPVIAASAEAKRENLKVRVTVSGESSDEIASFVKRELRSLGDVEITDDSDATRLDIVCLRAVGKSGTVFGYAGSILASSPSPSKWIGSFIAQQKEIPEQYGPRIATMLEDYQHLYLHQLFLSSTTRSIAEQIVVAFDTKVLEGERSARSELRKLFKPD